MRQFHPKLESSPSASPICTAKEQWLALACLLGVFIAYFPALHAGFIWDDDRYVTNNRLLAAPDGLWRIWFSQDAPSQYVPFTYTTFWLEHFLWEMAPTGYHVINVLLHTLNGWLLWRLLKTLAVPGAGLAAAMFLLHPVHVESVAWISERKNVLSLLFMLLATRAWVQFLYAPPPINARPYRHALILHALALASKATACTLPAALVVVLWLKGLRVDRRRMLQIAPFVVMGIAMGIIAVWWERNHQGTEGVGFSISLLERFLVAGRAVWFHLGKLIWPLDLTFIYPQWQINASNPWAYAGTIAVCLAVSVIYFTRRQIGNGIGIAGLFYLGMLAPLLGFIMLYTFRYTFVADHYQYVASIGPVTLLAAGLARWGRRQQNAALGAGLALLTLLGFLTWKQTHIYQDLGTLWRDTLVKNPGCWMAENNLGNFLARKGKPEEAIIHYQKALTIKPDYAEAHYNWADALMRQNSPDTAIAHLQEAVRIDPKYFRARNNLGIVLLQTGQPQEAIAQFEAAIEHRPQFNPGYLNLALALSKTGRQPEAIQRLNQALTLNPNDKDARILLNQLLLQSPAQPASPRPP